MAKVKVKIAVVVQADGNWGCCGYPVLNPRDPVSMMDMALESCGAEGKPETQYWVTAELDLPVVSEVTATSEKASS